MLGNTEEGLLCRTREVVAAAAAGVRADKMLLTRVVDVFKD